MLGDKKRVDELLSKIPNDKNVQYSTNPNDASLPRYDVVFDLNFDDSPDSLQYYSFVRHKTVFVGAVKNQLAQVFNGWHVDVKCNIVGMNTLPTFIERDLTELTVYKPEDEAVVKKILEELGWQYKLVQDRVGMVTPRVVFMIINEACYTLQEGTAGITGIDNAMKLGTNYPMGPFEWCDAIGIKDVYETLDAIYRDTRDERYKICPLLKTKYLKGERFYP